MGGNTSVEIAKVLSEIDFYKKLLKKKLTSSQ